MILLHGKTSFGRPSASSLASKVPARMLVFDNTNSRSMWIYLPIVFTPERLLVFIPSKTRERKNLHLFLLSNISVFLHLTFSFFICRPYDAKNPFLAPVKVNRELHGPTSERSCMHIEFDIEDSKMRYEAGDHLAVYPVNNVELVKKIGEQCGANLDTVFTLTNTDGELLTYSFVSLYLSIYTFFVFYRGIHEETSVPLSLQL